MKRIGDIADRVAALDPGLFSFIEAQSGDWDRHALLALHAAAADALGSFAYLEIGSYRGGSLQALMRDPRCRSVMSIDLRTVATPDDRGGYEYAHDNTTERMLELLRNLPDVQMDKLTTFDAGTDMLAASDLPERPNVCFIDGEHTYDAVIRDARFCAEALGGTGVIAFHDYPIVGAAISSFLRDNWNQISFALAFTVPSEGGVFALEMGSAGLLRHPSIKRAVSSRWHSAAWQAANIPRRTALPFLVTWATMPAIDSCVLQAHRFREYTKRHD